MAPEAVALLAAVSFALFAVYGWLGLLYSTPLVGTIVSLAARTVTLGAAVALSGGVPEYKTAALTVFVALGLLQSAISLLTFTGLQKIGTSRSQPLRNSFPLWSALIAVAVMHENAGFAVIAGTLLVVAGVVLISRKPGATSPSYRPWHVMYSLGAGLLAGLAFPLRRYGLTISNEPIFFSFVVAVVSLSGSLPYLLWKRADQRLVWHPKGVLHFFCLGFLRGHGCAADSRRPDHRQGGDRRPDRRHHAAFQSDHFLDLLARQGKSRRFDDRWHSGGGGRHHRHRDREITEPERS